MAFKRKFDLAVQYGLGDRGVDDELVLVHHVTGISTPAQHHGIYVECGVPCRDGLHGVQPIAEVEGADVAERGAVPPSATPLQVAAHAHLRVLRLVTHLQLLVEIHGFHLVEQGVGHAGDRGIVHRMPHIAARAALHPP